MNDKIRIHILLYSLIFNIGCTVNNLTVDPPPNKKIADAVRKYLWGCPEFFIPPREGTNGTQKNTVGTVAWTPSSRVGKFSSIENKYNYIQKIQQASVDNQTNYSQYLESEGTGFPGYFWRENGEDKQFPHPTYQAGFVCYILVYNGIVGAGINYPIDAPLGVGDLLDRLKLTNATSVAVGDVVLYDFDRNNFFDHAGIITDISSGTGGNGKDFKVISSIGIVEHFLWGAAEKRVRVFGDKQSGGDFNNWHPDLNNYIYEFFKVKTD
ncbi:MAG: hypothetical protein QME58_12420 [Bacteroidota bacterium]|nr:hypothetical protein [Bacteroidota bacterium]